MPSIWLFEECQFMANYHLISIPYVVSGWG